VPATGFHVTVIWLVLFGVAVSPVGTPGGTRGAALIVTARFLLPVPPAFVALIATVVGPPAVDGMPEINPVEVLMERFAGNPVAL
jgi:hypothetical protein